MAKVIKVKKDKIKLEVKIDYDFKRTMVVNELIEDLDVQEDEIKRIQSIHEPKDFQLRDLYDSIEVRDAIIKLLKYYTHESERKELGLNF